MNLCKTKQSKTKNSTWSSHWKSLFLDPKNQNQIYWLSFFLFLIEKVVMVIHCFDFALLLSSHIFICLVSQSHYQNPPSCKTKEMLLIHKKYIIFNFMLRDEVSYGSLVKVYLMSKYTISFSYLENSFYILLYTRNPYPFLNKSF